MDDAEDARVGREARVAKLAREAAIEEIHLMWGKFGVDSRTEKGIERHLAVLDWARRSSDRAAGQGKRLMAMFSIFTGGGAFLLGVLKWIVDSYHSNGGSGGSH